MQTQLSYFNDTYKFNDPTMIVTTNKDDSEHFIILNQTLFYPQGGGQPSDQGTIQVGDILIPIHSVKCVDQEIRHYTDQSYSHLSGQTGMCILNPSLRLLHARLHTSGHLISNIIESHYPRWKAIKGHHFPGQCYVEFTVKNGTAENISLEWLNQETNHLIKKDCLTSMEQVSGDVGQKLCPNLTYTIPKDQPIRVIRIGDFPLSPCGGTHVKSLRELKGLAITKYKIKKNSMKIYYDIQHN